jgi:SAM-dependent methyltransferase
MAGRREFDADMNDQTGCPICGSKTHAPFERAQDAGMTLNYVFCKNCGVVYQLHRLDVNALSSFYRETYREIVQGSQEPTEKDLRVQAGRARALLKLLSASLDEIRNHLDIGSSAGTLLREVRKAYQCQAIGVEPGDAYRDYSRQKGTDTVADLEDLPAEFKSSFDLVSMVHVLEHLPSPLEILRTIRRQWMTDDGILLVEVPNLFGHTCFEIAHLAAFSPAALEGTLRRAGFEVLQLKSHGAPRSKIIPLYLTAIARPEPSLESNDNSLPSYLGTRARRAWGKTWKRLAGSIAPSLAWLPWPELEFDDSEERGEV